MIRSRVIYTLLTLVIVLYFAPAKAQNSSTAKKTHAKTVTKKAPAKKAPTKPKSTANKSGNAAAAQDTTKKGGGKNPKEKNNASLSEEIIVTTAYKPVLADAVKIRRNPDLEDKTPFKAPLTYITLDKTLGRNTDIRQLDAMKMPAERDSVPGNNFAKAELGNLKTVLGEVYINNGQDNALQVGGFARHFSNESASVNKQSQIKDEVGIFGKAVTDDNTFKGSINYNRLGTNFYGYDHSNPPLLSAIPPKQHFSTLSAQGEITRNYDTVQNPLTYAVKVNGYIFRDAYQARENNLVVTGFLNKTVNQFYAGLSASLDLSTQKDSLYSYNNSLIRLNPYLKFQGDNYKVDAGLNLVRGFGFSTQAYVFPAVKLELQVVPKYLRLFAEATGDVNKASLHDDFETNPFLDQNIPIQNSVDRLDISMGLKGSLLPGLGFKATIFRNSVKDLALFINNTTSGFNKFSVVYDNGNARISGFTGELDYKLLGMFDIFGNVEFKDYKMASQAEPWNLPKFKLTAGTSVTINSKVTITGSVLYRGATMDVLNRINTTQAGIAQSSIVNISAFTEINAGVEYKVTNKISIFVNANNLLNTTNQVWLNYPGYGFNIFGGVGYHF